MTFGHNIGSMAFGKIAQPGPEGKPKGPGEGEAQMGIGGNRAWGSHGNGELLGDPGGFNRGNGGHKGLASRARENPRPRECAGSTDKKKRGNLAFCF